MKTATASKGFSGHETFPFRYGWLTKGVACVIKTPTIFSREDATTELGVGKNMVKSICHWLLACGLIEPSDAPKSYRVSFVGNAIFAPEGSDPYLEDLSTLWLLHFFLCRSEGRSESWYWLFNVWKSREFQRDELVRELTAVASSSRANANTVRRDVECLLRTYVTSRSGRSKLLTEDSLDCPLAELALIEEVGDGQTYAFQVGDHRTLTSEVFAYCLLDYWDRYHPAQDTLAFEQVLYAPGSPARIFKLSYAALIRHLEALGHLTERAVYFEETSGLRQVYRTSKVQSRALLGCIYRQAVPA